MPTATQPPFQIPVADDAGSLSAESMEPNTRLGEDLAADPLAGEPAAATSQTSLPAFVIPPKRSFLARRPRVAPPTFEAEDEEETSQERGPQDVEAVVAVFRTLVLGMALLLPSVFAPQTFASDPESAHWLMWLGLTAAAYNIAAVIASVFPARFGLRRPLIIAMDTLLVSGWIALSRQFGLFPFYGIVVVLAGLWGRAFGALATAIVCDFIYLLVWANNSSDMETYVRFDTHMAIACVTLPIMGSLVGYLVEMQERERARRREGQLLLANYEREIDLSRQMQTVFFGVGRGNVQFSQLELGVAARMARTIGGGDFFDALPLKDGSTLLCIADVSGKSARAQSRLPLLKYALRALAPLYHRPRELVPHLNALISPELDGELYIAACYVRLVPQEGRLEWCNAGHIAPLLIRGEASKASDASPSQAAPLVAPSGLRVTPLETTGPPLGMFEETEYGFGSLPWHPGDAILLYTDGLSDAFSFEGAEDGEAQVSGLAARLSSSEEAARVSAERFLEMALAVLDTERQAPLLPLSSLPRRSARPDLSKRSKGAHRDDITVAVARFPVSAVATSQPSAAALSTTDKPLSRPRPFAKNAQ